jgi:hypothetical protein
MLKEIRVYGDVKWEVPPIVEGEDVSGFKTKRGPLLVDQTDKSTPMSTASRSRSESS